MKKKHLVSISSKGGNAMLREVPGERPDMFKLTGKKAKAKQIIILYNSGEQKIKTQNAQHLAP